MFSLLMILAALGWTGLLVRNSRRKADTQLVPKIMLIVLVFGILAALGPIVYESYLEYFPKG